MTWRSREMEKTLMYNGLGLRKMPLAALLLLYASSALAAKPEVGSPWGDTLLRQMSDYLRAADEFSFRTEVTRERVLKTGQKIQFSRAARVFVRRPDKLYVELRGDLENERIWYDGEHFTVLNTDSNEYERARVRGNIDRALDHMAQTYGESSPLADLVYSNPYAILVENVETGMYVGLHEVRGVKCHHLAFTQKNIDWQIWIEDGARPVPCKAVITYKNMESVPQFTAVLYDWEFSPHLPDSLFRFHPRTGAVEMDFVPVGR